MKALLQIIFQIGILYLFYFIGLWIQTTFQLLIPGSIIGMLLLFCFLLTKKFKFIWIEKGASFLLSHLSLLFIPITVGVIDFLDFFKGPGIYAVVVVVVSTIFVMITSSLTSHWIVKRKMKSSLAIQHVQKREGL